MRQLLITILFISILNIAKAQDLDSLLSTPQTLELIISTPQPRLKEKFQISLDINYLRLHIFKSAIGKIQLADEIGSTDNDKMILNVNALTLGKTEIGPLKFTVNGTTYTTNKVSYEVIEALPKVDEGLWIRKVITGDSTFCIIIEQRIPASGKKINTSDNSFTLTTEPEYSNVAKFKDYYSIKGLSMDNANSYSDFQSIYDVNGNQKQFMFSYYIYHFRIENKAIPIKITKDVFEHLPSAYKFEEITIQ